MKFQQKGKENKRKGQRSMKHKRREKKSSIIKVQNGEKDMIIGHREGKRKNSFYVEKCPYTGLLIVFIVLYILCTRYSVLY